MKSTHPSSNPLFATANNYFGIRQSANGRLYRVQPVIHSFDMEGLPRYKAGGLRRCDADGNFIPRVRQSKKARLRLRRLSALHQGAGA